MKWTEKSALNWINTFWHEHRVVPSSSLRDNYNGPNDETLINLFGGTKRALDKSDAVLSEARIASAYKYEYSRTGKLNENVRQRKEDLNAQTLVIKCANCPELNETFTNATQALEFQREHRLTVHGVEEPPKRKKQPKKSFSRGLAQIPGV